MSFFGVFFPNKCNKGSVLARTRRGVRMKMILGECDFYTNSIYDAFHVPKRGLLKKSDA